MVLISSNLINLIITSCICVHSYENVNWAFSLFVCIVKRTYFQHLFNYFSMDDFKPQSHSFETELRLVSLFYSSSFLITTFIGSWSFLCRNWTFLNFKKKKNQKKFSAFSFFFWKYRLHLLYVIRHKFGNNGRPPYSQSFRGETALT